MNALKICPPDSLPAYFPSFPMELSHLSNKFATEDIEWRIGRAGKSGDKIWATCLAYVTNRAIMDRLDSVCSPENWQNEFAEWKIGNDHGVRCGISIRCDMGWVTKFDGAQPSNMEPIKGAFSDSMKRAAVQWGIGRYLYDLDEGFATIVEKGARGARYGSLPKDKTTGKSETFYWLPPELPSWALPTQNLATPAQIAKITELINLTDTKADVMWKHYNTTPETVIEKQAAEIIKTLTKKLEASSPAQ
jgi:hypothetical protein